MEVTGIILKKLGDSSGTSAKTGMPWRNAEFLVEIPGEYKRHINFRARDGQHDMIARFESLLGKMVKVSFNIEAHEANGRWFNEIRAWGVMEYVPGQVTAGEAVKAGGTVKQPQQDEPAHQPTNPFAELEQKAPSMPPDYKLPHPDELPF